MPFGPFSGNKKSTDCRDERIGVTRAPTCQKRRSVRATELLANECRFCGRPFELDKLEGGETPPEVDL